MSWFTSRPQNRLRRHDLKGLDGRLRTRLRQQRQVRFTMVAFAVILSLAGIGWGAWLLMELGARRLFSENPAYQIREIMVESSGPAVPVLRRDYVRDHLHLHLGQNLFALDLQRLRHDLELLPVVEKAEVARELPNRLLIRITERIPLASISAGPNGRRLQIDEQGMVMDLSAFEKSSPDLQKRLKSLSQITGARVTDLKPGRAVSNPEIAQAIVLIQQMDKAELGMGLEIGEIDVSRRGMLILRTSDGAVVKVGLSSMDKQLNRLGVILNDARQRSLRIATVDLTVGRDVPVTFVSAQQ